jgi:putative transposase
MIKPAHRIYLHLAWSTLDRRSMIDAATHAFLDRFVRRVAIAERVELLALGILQTHVHILLRMPTKFDLPHLVQLLKGGSSYEASRLEGNKVGLRWSREYSVDSVGHRSLSRWIAYIQGQDLHHPMEAVDRPARERSGSPSTRFSV